MYEPKVGDRVRVTVEGELDGVRQGGDVLVSMAGGLWRWYFPASRTTIEKIEPPLPTTPGSLVRRARGEGLVYRRLTKGGQWRDLTGVLPDIPDPRVTIFNYEVIFDAGAK